jgi:hypothetical protein
MTAAVAAARGDKQKLEAAQANLKRLTDLYEKVEELHTHAARGGEAIELATISYYVADAHLRLAALTEPPGPIPNVEPAPAAKASTSQTFERKASPVIASGPRYQGKSFEEWQATLHEEIDPRRREEALKALGEFAANGRGTEVAELILKMMRGYSVWLTDLFNNYNSPSNQVVKQAFHAMKMVPGEELLPMLLRTLDRSQPASQPRVNKNQRLFALSMLPYATPEPRESVPYLRQNLSDSHIHVRSMARLYITALDHESPETAEMIRAALKSPNRDDVIAGVALAGGIPTITLTELGGDSRGVFALAPELIELLGSGDSKIAFAAREALRRMLTDEVRAQVEAAQKSDNPRIAAGAADVLAPRYAPPSPVPPSPYAPQAVPYTPPYPAPPATVDPQVVPPPNNPYPAAAPTAAGPAVP